MGERWVRRALLVEDQPFMRMLVAESLTTRGFDVQVASRADEALKLIDEFDPDVLVTDVELGSRPDGLELASIARANAPYLAIVFLTNFPRALTEDRKNPVSGAVHVDKATLSSTEELFDAVDRALKGSDEVPVRPTPAHRTEDAVLSLTRHQRRVLALLAAGLSNTEIAERTESNLRAVERTVSRVFDHLDISNDPGMNPRVVAANRYNRTFGPLAT